MTNRLCAVAAAALLALGLTGCAVPPHSNESEAGVMLANSVANIKPVVASAKALMEHQYAPASTKVMLVEPADTFGKAFVEALRTAGYAVYEKPLLQPIKNGEPVPFECPADAKKITYVLDAVSEDGSLFRLLLKVDQKRYSAVFRVGVKGIAQASPWSLI